MLYLTNGNSSAIGMLHVLSFSVAINDRLINYKADACLNFYEHSTSKD